MGSLRFRVQGLGFRGSKSVEMGGVMFWGSKKEP